MCAPFTRDAPGGGLVYEADTRVKRRGGRVATHETEGTKEESMPVWAWVLIIVLIVFVLGGFGYRRRR